MKNWRHAYFAVGCTRTSHRVCSLFLIPSFLFINFFPYSLNVLLARSLSDFFGLLFSPSRSLPYKYIFVLARASTGSFPKIPALVYFAARPFKLCIVTHENERSVRARMCIYINGQVSFFSTFSLKYRTRKLQRQISQRAPVFLDVKRISTPFEHFPQIDKPTN